ncbi:MAG TPA: hypothetical protein VG097_03845 [Gemmata sp.]|nr:hypothetical protein [Gemmata sp.]
MKAMLIWEVILTADRMQDLADPSVYPEWFHGLFRYKPPIRVEGDSVIADMTEVDVPKPLGLLVFQAAWEAPDDRLWCSPIRDIWEQSIRSLRFAVKLVRSTKTRNPGIEGSLASAIWRDYVGRPRMQVRFNKENGKFSRYQLVASPGSVFHGSQGLWNQLNSKQRELTKSIDTLFQNAFSSLVDGIEAPRFCVDCNREMESKTSTGRASRKTICQKCTELRWRKNRGQENVREQWRRNKEEERERKRSGQ